MNRLALKTMVLALAACGGGGEADPGAGSLASAPQEPRARILSLGGGPDRATADPATNTAGPGAGATDRANAFDAAESRSDGRGVAPALREVVTISISVPDPLVIGGALLTLRIGDATFRLGQALSVPNQGMRAARFTLSPDAFAALPDGAAMVLENGAQRFDLGKLDKARLR